jgi:hypothetical protein
MTPSFLTSPAAAAAAQLYPNIASKKLTKKAANLLTHPTKPTNWTFNGNKMAINYCTLPI